MPRSAQANDPYKCIIKNELENLEKLLSTDPNLDINAPISKNGLTPLMVAVIEKKSLIINLILNQKGLNINLQDTFGRTALHYAAANGDMKTQEKLTREGGLIDAQTNAGETPFMKACFFMEKLTLEFMLKKYHETMNLDLKDSLGCNSLDILKRNLHLTPELDSLGDSHWDYILEVLSGRLAQESQETTPTISNKIKEGDQMLLEENLVEGT